MLHEQFDRPQSFDLVDPSAIAIISHGPQPEKSVPDMPASVGMILIGAYLTIISLLALTIANAGEGPFIIVIDLVFLAAFFTVPALFLRTENDKAIRPTMMKFLEEGMQTYTGRVSGAGALVQMLVVPVLLAFGVLCIGTVAIVSL